MKKHYILGAESIFLDGSNHGILLLHGGGGGTTWDLKEFATFANKKGYTIWLPSLDGFNTKPEDLINVSFQNWIENGLDGLEKLQETCEKVSVVGHSLGGLISLILAAETSSISSIVTWAAAWGINNRMLSLLPYISKVPLMKNLIPSRIPVEPSEELVEMGWLGYEWLPATLGFEFLDAIKFLKRQIRFINCPTFVIQGNKDITIKSNSARIIYNKLKTKIKELWIIEHATHTLMQESCKSELFERTLNFINEY